MPTSRLSCLLSLALFFAGCDTPVTNVVLENRYAASPNARVVYRAKWQSVTFADPIAPGAASEPQSALAASANTAYVVLAPGWDPASGSPPTSFIVLQSRTGYGLNLDDTLHIPVDDTTFTGNCAAGEPLSSAQADFITQRLFPDDFASFVYDAKTCTTTFIGDAGAD